MKKLTLFFSLALLLCACSVLKNKSKSKTLTDSTSTKVYESKSIDTSTTITTMVVPGVTEQKKINLPPYTTPQFQYLLSTFNALNASTQYLKLTVDSASKTIKLNLYKPPSSTTITQKLAQTVFFKQKVAVKTSKKTAVLAVQVKRNYWLWLLVLPLFYILYLVYKK